MIYDVIIVGGGPAGLSAAIYAKRARMEVLLIESGFFSGGQIINTHEIDNYPGFYHKSGMELGEAFEQHAKELLVTTVRETVTDLVLEGNVKRVKTTANEYETKTVILAMGAKFRTLSVPGEEKFTGSGVSYCATCDGAFFRNKTVAIVGGGDVAAADAIFLSRICKKIYMIHRRDKLRCAAIYQEHLRGSENVEFVWDSVLKEIQGDAKVTSLLVQNVKTNATKELPVDGVFIAVGNVPNNELIKDKLTLDGAGYVCANEDGRTNIPGVLVAGDLRTKPLRQVVTAVSDGANCITSIEEYLIQYSCAEK